MTCLPRRRSSSAWAPWPSVSSKTMTSAQSTSARQLSDFGTKPSAMSFSLGASIEYLTSWPSFSTCQAMSPIRPPRETKRNFFRSGMALLVQDHHEAVLLVHGTRLVRDQVVAELRGRGLRTLHQRERVDDLRPALPRDLEGDLDPLGERRVGLVD